MEYKTPELKNMLLDICSQFPIHADKIMKFEKAMSKINLNAHVRNDETFRQIINLNNGCTIELTWNINKIIKYAKYHPQNFNTDSPFDIYNSPNFNFTSAVTTSTINAVKFSIKNNITYIHKIPYIIIAQLPFVTGYCIIDGNHNFFEALLTNKSHITYFLITDDECLPFLQKESQKYIRLCKRIQRVIDNSQ